MSRMKDELSSPIPVPEVLERAWTWMEEQGFGDETPNGYFLAPYEGPSQMGIVFGAEDDALDSWFEPGTPAAERIVAIAEVSGDGSTGAMWLDDDGEVRFVVMGSDGEAFLMADDAANFCRLVAIGYDEYLSFTLVDEPEDEESVEAHDEFRTWVEAEIGPVPAAWTLPEDDHGFEAWVEANRPQ